MEMPSDKRGLSHGGRVREIPTRKPITEFTRFHHSGRAIAVGAPPCAMIVLPPRTGVGEAAGIRLR